MDILADEIYAYTTTEERHTENITVGERHTENITVVERRTENMTVVEKHADRTVAEKEEELENF